MSEVITLPPRLRVIDCQSEGVMAALEGTVRQFNPPGVDIQALLAKQARERLIRRAKEAWQNWCEATDAVFAIKDVGGDPAEHMAKYIQDTRGKASS